MNGVIGIAGVLGVLVLAGAAIALLQPGRVAWRWLAAAGGLVLLNDALLTNLYGVLPQLWSDADWNWQGKLLALAATMAIAAMPAFGWRASGLTRPQGARDRQPVLAVAALYLAIFLGLALAFPTEPASAETIAFQLTLPGLEEEPFYRGLLLLVLGRAFTTRWRLAGVDWHWGSVLSCVLFGLTHAFGYGKAGFSFDPLTFILTGGPSFVGVWLALRTRSVLIPIALHNFGNAITLLV